MPDKISKFIASLDSKTRKRVLQKLKRLRENPRGVQGSEKMKNRKESYRLRMGKIRANYRLKNEEVEVLDIDWRGNIYKK